jgi:predicted dehydrogenase
MSTTSRFSRRDLLHRSGLAAAYATGSVTFGANDTIQVACIGTGGRCRELMRTLQRVGGVRITAVCDIWDMNLAEGRKLADPKAFASKDYREILARSDVDAVVIGAPDHWHARMTIDACTAGKDVYVEKPLTHAPEEGAPVIAAQNRYRRIVQVGMQQRSMPHLQKAAEIVKSGKLGKIHKVHMSWNRNQQRRGPLTVAINPASVDWKRFLGTARDQPFDAYRFRNWRWFWISEVAPSRI